MQGIDTTDGIRLSGTDLYFDSEKKVPLSFISNANVNSLPNHKKIIATPETIKLLGNKIKNSVVLSCPYNKPFTLGKAQIELIPSGYILGGSQIVVEEDGKRLVYTGDFKLRYSKTAEYIEMRRCDTLVMKCIYGLPKFSFPETEVVMESILDFIRETLSAGKIPIVVVDKMGKAQDLITYLGDRSFDMCLHPTIVKVLKLYEELGVKFPYYENLKRKNLKNKVVIIPPYFRGSNFIENIQNKKVCVVMGWSMDNGAFVRSAFKADVAFPLSNHAGYEELLQYVDVAKPKEIFLVDGFSIEFARTLNKYGYNAKPLKSPTQLNLF